MKTAIVTAALISAGSLVACSGPVPEDKTGTTTSALGALVNQACSTDYYYGLQVCAKLFEDSTENGKYFAQCHIQSGVFGQFGLGPYYGTAWTNFVRLWKQTSTGNVLVEAAPGEGWYLNPNDSVLENTADYNPGSDKVGASCEVQYQDQNEPTWIYTLHPEAPMAR